jgi:hypothetical protein
VKEVKTKKPTPGGDQPTGAGEISGQR